MLAFFLFYVGNYRKIAIFKFEVEVSVMLKDHKAGLERGQLIYLKAPGMMYFLLFSGSERASYRDM